MTVKGQNSRVSAQGVARAAWRGYAYLYYRIYAWNLRTWGESDLPQWNAMFGVSFLLFCNIITLIEPFDFFLGTGIVFRGETLTYHVFFIGGVCGYLTYRAFVRKGKYKSLGQQFCHETTAARRWHTLFCWTYALGSIILMFVEGVLIHIFG